MRVRSFSVVVRRLAIVGLALLSLVPARAATTTTFKNPELIPTSTDPLDIVAADVNNDGKLDLLYVDGQNYGQHTLHVLLGRGNGTFSHGEDISLPSNVCCALTVADVTNDGKSDILLAGNNEFAVNLVVLVGNGDGTFQAPILTTFTPSSATGYPGFRSPVAVGDINGDGKVDLALMDYANGAIYTLLGNDSGSFTLNGTLQTYTGDAVYLLDLNGDGKLDILTTYSIGAEFLVYLGKGDGTFPAFTRYSLQTSAGPFLPIDVNGDGHLDVLVQYYPGQLGYFPGNPDGTFGALVSLGNTPSSNQLVSASDLNGDGIFDLTYVTPSGIAVALGETGPSFGAPLTTITGGSTSPYSELPVTPVRGDFNGDGHMDLAMAAEGGIVILLGHGDGTFSSADFYDMGQEAGAAAVATFTGHTYPDIAVALPATFPRLLLGNGSGTFTLGPDPNTSYASAGADVALLAGDFNGDGKPDLSMGPGLQNEAFLGTQSVAINSGGGTFETPVFIPNTSPVMADFNHDGRMDMVAVTGGQIVVSLGQADGTFQAVTTALRLPGGTGHFNVGDLNNDGKPDLALDFGDHIEVWLGNGDGTFVYSNSVDLTGIVSDFVAAIADLDGDGNADIVLAPDANVGASLGPLTIFYGNGNGTFQPPVFIAISHRYSWITVADLNGDGKPDLVLTDGAAIAVMMNLGSRNFDAEVDYVAGRSVSVPVNVADVNADGFPDIVVANSGGTTVTVLLNEPNGVSPEGAFVKGTLGITPEPSIYNQPFTITLSVSGQAAGGPVPTGAADFYVDGAFIATAPMSNGSASYVDSATLIPVQHTIIATYDGDSHYAPKSFSSTHTVQPPVYSTHTTLSASPSSILASQTIRLVATVTSTPLAPGGVVTFYDGTNSLGAETIDAQGNARLDTALLASGTHSLTAEFQGFEQIAFTGSETAYTAAIFSPSTSSSETVLVGADATTTTLSSSAPSLTLGAVVTFTASISSPAGTPFGGATFYDGTNMLGTSGLESDGTAAFSTASLSEGTHTITASFNANGPFAASTSAPLSIPVTSAAATAVRTILSLAPEMNPADGSATFAANVGGLSGASAGTVTFLDSGTILGTAPTDQTGVARLRVRALADGAHNFSASFAGAPEIAPSASPAFTDEWPETGPGFSMSAAGRSLRVGRLAPESVAITIEAFPNFRQEVQLSCASGLPQGYVCDFRPAVLDGGGVSTLTIRSSTTTARDLPGTISFCALGLLLFSTTLLGTGHGRRSRAVLLLVLCCNLGLLSGCSYMPSPESATRMKVVTVRATSGSGAATIIHSTQIELNVDN
ncbi:MAG TPA: FG-GAP-like repeat-containing protein [Candidatus Acidoferrales bacterium]|jgi:hypothetical protein|nr:FG-GAP-like repeat-containing protein [Candidatus Acidoferrales bacterium]